MLRTTYSLEEAKEIPPGVQIKELIGNSFRNKRKSNQVIRKKRLLFDKVNPENVSTSDFLDTTINPISCHGDMHPNIVGHKYFNMHSSFEDNHKLGGRFKYI